MDATKLQTLKGFRDFLPKEAKKRQFAIDKIKKTFSNFGFEPLETPALEYEELLLGKYGEEGDKLIYRFTDLGGRNVAMRYDQTVPTARILAMYNQSLPMPWRRYQIQPVWRAENTQAGRYREFLQCDADIYGSPSPLADAEIIALANSLYKALGFADFKIYINDRNILFELMNYASISPEYHLATIAAIDKLDRKTKDEVKADLVSLGLNESSIDHLFHHMDEAKPTDALNEVIDNAKMLGVEEGNFLFEARLARGLDYYTSTIFEIKIDDYRGGAVAGGGRYDGLIGQLSGVEIPAVGFAIGFDRTLEAMEQFKLFPIEGKRDGILVSVFSPELTKNSLEAAASLREGGIPVEVYPDAMAKLDKQLKYADKKGIKWLVVIGPEEVEKNKVILKDLETGHQEDVDLNEVIEKAGK
jgi:histidyl-tRNA synthetase